MKPGPAGAHELAPKDTLDHAWRYFALHAGQRMSMFNYFVIVFGVVSAGLAGCLRTEGKLRLLGVALGLALAVVSFVFWKLDQRTAFLIKHAEAALAEAEDAYSVQAALFRREPQDTADAKMVAGMWTYGKSFRTVFFLGGGFGLAGAGLSLALFVSQP